MLQGKRALVVGVANARSIAWGIADRWRREGAEVFVTYRVRVASLTTLENAVGFLSYFQCQLCSTPYVYLVCVHSRCWTYVDK